ncbi:MAG: hypothetical protein CXR31_06180 [Geobacter sp.]|nr:MAG: hypothetical protein CXR31_06180 [Geobacter sp.]
MLIRAIFEDYTRGMVRDSNLDTLIQQGKIVGFFRSDGYVRVGHDQVRGTGGEYKGQDRRRHHTEYQ